MKDIINRKIGAHGDEQFEVKSQILNGHTMINVVLLALNQVCVFPILH